jgi:hypothetical protein
VVAQVAHLCLVGLQGGRVGGRGFRARLQKSAQLCPQHRQVGDERHAQGDDHVELPRELGGEDALGDGLAERDKGKLAARGQQQARAQRGDARQAKGLARGHHDGQLARDEDDDRREDGLPLRAEQLHADLHADRHEEQAHQQALVRGDVRLDLEGILGLGDEQAREERAQRQ